MKIKFTLAALLLGGNLFAQTTADSVTLRGAVTDFNGIPIDSCTIMWQNSSFNDVVQVFTNSQGHYSARIPKGKYQSMAAIRLGDYPHTAKPDVSEADQRLEFWAWDFIADRDTTLDIRYHRMEVYGLRAFRIPGGMPTWQIYVRPMSLTHFQQIMKQGYDAKHGEDLSGIQQETSSKNAKGIFAAPHACPKGTTSLPYHIFKVELGDVENGDWGEGLYYMEKDSYIE